jgi:uncharacterized coiled-coil protein SlyX
MSDADATTEPSVTTKGVTVTKSYETDEFPVPAVAFRFRSERDVEAMIRLTDPVPDSVPPEDLGFHPDYGRDHWSVEEGNAVFERRLDPDEEYETVYGIRTSDHDPEQFMTDPTLDVEGLGDDTDETETEDTDGTDESDDAGDVPGRDSSQAARDIISGEGDVSGLDDANEAVEEVDISGSETSETDDTVETSEPPEATDETEHESGTDDSEAGVSIPEGGIGAALAAEIRDGNLSESDRELLTEELTAADAGSEVRLTHLQSRISDLEAYTDALEGFIDEHGPARQLIEDMTDQLETIEAELDDLDERTAANEDDIETLDGRAAENAEDIDALREDVADMESEINETQESVADLDAAIEEINGWRTRIATVIADVPESETKQS